MTFWFCMTFMVLLLSFCAGLLSPLIIVQRHGYIAHTISHLGVTIVLLRRILPIPSLLLSPMMYLLFIMICLDRDFGFVSMIGHLVISVVPLLGISQYYSYSYLFSYDITEYMMIILVLILYILLITFYHRSLIQSYISKKITISPAQVCYYTMLVIVSSLSFDLCGPMAGFILLIGPGSVALNLVGNITNAMFFSGALSLISTLLALPLYFSNSYADLGVGPIYALTIGIFYIISLIVKMYRHNYAKSLVQK